MAHNNKMSHDGDNSYCNLSTIKYCEMDFLQISVILLTYDSIREVDENLNKYIKSM